MVDLKFRRNFRDQDTVYSTYQPTIGPFIQMIVVITTNIMKIHGGSRFSLAQPTRDSCLAPPVRETVRRDVLIFVLDFLFTFSDSTTE
jgi:hypothetical protein